MSALKVAVIGAGHLGRIHTRLLSNRTDVELLGIVEPQAETRERVAQEFQTRGFPDLSEVVDQLDAAVVVTPTKHHHAVALPLLQRGIPCFVEKPITLLAKEADALIAAAQRSQVVLQVGHVERFNPALTSVRDSFGAVKYLEATRTSSYTFRSIDIGVVLDMMIHDIDIVLSLAQSEVVDVRAIGTPVFGPHEDMAQARLEFASGCVANLTASRVSYTQQRTLQVVSSNGFASLDLGAKKATLVGIGDAVANGEIDVYKASPAEVAAIKEGLFTDYLPKQEVVVTDTNAIADEHTDFFTAIRERRQPIVTGQQGRDALAVAQAIVEAIQKPQVLRTPVRRAA